MKQKAIILVMVFFVAAISTKAQETVSAVGGEATGSGGSISYTVGQVVYTTSTGSGGNSVTQGVQQPYEVSVVTGIKESEGINLSISAYPNPTADYLNLKIINYETANLQFQIFDVNGKLLQSVKATGQVTKIAINNLVPSNYFVKVMDNKKEIKVFKIIKFN